MKPDDKPKGSIDRRYLIQKLRERGVSHRAASLILNAMFREMAEALARDEEVDFGLGKLQRYRHPRPRKRGWYLGRITTIYQKPYTVRWLQTDGSWGGSAEGRTDPEK